MKVLAASAIVLIASCSVSLASGDNDIALLRTGDLVNVSELAIGGSFNRLMIEQRHPGAGSANRVSVDIKGDRNGGPDGAKFAPMVSKAGLTPGAIRQMGLGNSVTVTVRGEDNLFAINQSGNNNMVSGKIVGYQNQASVAQVGNNNFASFSQNGIGNMISVRQYSW
jgi:hypothetical protein